MPDYANYIDDETIAKAESAFQKGEYNVSSVLFSKSLDRLDGYQGDRMYPILLGGELMEKLRESEKLLADSQEIKPLIPKYWKLSKSSFLKGKQCEKFLYLDKFKKKEKTPPSEEQLELFKRGNNFENHFRASQFPNGINIKDEMAMSFGHFNSYTEMLLEKEQECTLFEAALIENDILILVDVLKKNLNGSYDIFEIKLHTEINEVIWQDLFIQYYICKERFGHKINSFNLVLRNGDSQWEIRNLLKELESKIDGIEEGIVNFKNVLSLKTEPIVEMGSLCNEPYKCEFKAYCQKLKLENTV